MFNATKQLINKGYDVIYAINKNGKTTRLPKLHVCPVCETATSKHTPNKSLQRKAALHVVVGVSGANKVALCARCGFTKTNFEAPKKAAKKTRKKKAKA